MDFRRLSLLSFLCLCLASAIAHAAPSDEDKCEALAELGLKSASTQLNLALDSQTQKLNAADIRVGAILESYRQQILKELGSSLKKTHDDFSRLTPFLKRLLEADEKSQQKMVSPDLEKIAMWHISRFRQAIYPLSVKYIRALYPSAECEKYSKRFGETEILCDIPGKGTVKIGIEIALPPYSNSKLSCHDKICVTYGEVMYDPKNPKIDFVKFRRVQKRKGLYDGISYGINRGVGVSFSTLKTESFDPRKKVRLLRETRSSLAIQALSSDIQSPYFQAWHGDGYPVFPIADDEYEKRWEISVRKAEIYFIKERLVRAKPECTYFFETTPLLDVNSNNRDNSATPQGSAMPALSPNAEAPR